MTAVLTAGSSRVESAGSADWSRAVESVPHDIYHRAEYHSISGFGNQGTPFLFAYREQPGRMFLWPYLLNPIPGGEGWFDATSVYGYSGPVGSVGASSDGPDFVRRAWQSLTNHWREQRVVSVFTRFHPMLDNADLLQPLDGLQNCPGIRLLGSTVSIDLAIPPEEQVRRYQKILRQEIRKSRELGFVTEEDREWSHAADFLRVYIDTMLRRASKSEYLIDEAWIGEFRRALGPSHARLFVTRFEGRVAAALLAIVYPPFLHAHLTGIDAELAAHSPLKVLLDDVRQWGVAHGGLRWFHLGGGLGGREDSLFQFKRRFSPLIHRFHTGSWILDAARYRELEQAHRAAHSAQDAEISFFPTYRWQP